MGHTIDCATFIPYAEAILEDAGLPKDYAVPGGDLGNALKASCNSSLSNSVELLDGGNLSIVTPDNGFNDRLISVASSDWPAIAGNQPHFISPETFVKLAGVIRGDYVSLAHVVGDPKFAEAALKLIKQESNTPATIELADKIIALCAAPNTIVEVAYENGVSKIVFIHDEDDGVFFQDLEITQGSDYSQTPDGDFTVPKATFEALQQLVVNGSK